MSRHSNRALTEVLKTADPVTDTSPHLCRSTRGIDDATRGLDPATLAVPLLPPIDQWGYVPFPVRRLTPHSLSRRVRDLLSGDLGEHREYPVDPDEGGAARPRLAFSRTYVPFWVRRPAPSPLGCLVLCRGSLGRRGRVCADDGQRRSAAASTDWDDGGVDTATSV